MSGDQLASSFGNPNAQPPSPRQTPTSIAFPSPTFDSPATRQKSQIENPGPWTTPRFAEEYSVFDPNPEHVDDSRRPSFTACVPATSISHSRSPSLSLRRPLPAGHLAVEIASHANHFSPSPNLPSVDPSLRLSSSQLPSDTPREYSPDRRTPPTQTAPPYSPKKVRRGTIGVAADHHHHHHLPTQTATPPPSARKPNGGLVPGPTSNTMQNDEGYGHQDFMGTSHHVDMASFTLSQNDMFGYPMSAPVTTSPSYWDSSLAMSAMDLDFGSQAAGPSGVLFEAPAPSQQPVHPYDWSTNAALFQDPSTASSMPPQSSNQENIRPASRKERPLAPKPVLTNSSHPIAATSESTSLSGTYSATANNGFILSPGRGVDPGLLFSRPPSSDMDTHPFHPVSQSRPASRGLAAPAPLIPSNMPSDSLKRSYSYKETGRPGARESASSPIKPSGPRAGLQRSLSENRGRRQLPALAPAARPQPSSQVNGHGAAPSRPLPRQSGRLSPSKLHHRLSSLSSIPESSGPRTRTSVKFTIDARGRAHAETTVVVDDEPIPSGVYRPGSRDSSRRSQVGESDLGDSDTDDEPIIIPSRNASFALPDPHKPVGSIFHNSSKRSPRVRPSSSFDDRDRRTHSRDDDDDESEAETVVDGGAGNGDATSELRRVVEDRQKRAASQRPAHFDRGSFTWAAGNLLSPTTLTDSSMRTPQTGPRHYRIRCVCQHNEPSGAMDSFMVQCEACELWLHGRCINITRRDMPPVYICAFCANTPSMRGGGRTRDSGRSAMSPTGPGPSPLPAHKAFQSFR